MVQFSDGYYILLSSKSVLLLEGPHLFWWWFLSSDFGIAALPFLCKGLNWKNYSGSFIFNPLGDMGAWFMNWFVITRVYYQRAKDCDPIAGHEWSPAFFCHHFSSLWCTCLSLKANVKIQATFPTTWLTLKRFFEAL
jgi:hypothetical protein